MPAAPKLTADASTATSQVYLRCINMYLQV